MSLRHVLHFPSALGAENQRSRVVWSGCVVAYGSVRNRPGSAKWHRVSAGDKWRNRREESSRLGYAIPDRPARSSVAVPTELPGPPFYAV